MDYYIGGIVLFPYGFAPCGWMACEGQILNINENQALFALIGLKFGGNGRTTFALPNLRGAEPIPGMNYYIATQGIFPSRY
ncbi:phage tail protein [Clostridium aminobutyricum]|uniref:Tail fiber protein n=1 Tax=Clostridium aminobutyricum TaxID=33953 RepID=A0A939D8Y2_CLOAM|nr:tail fiber protein [Clostridium aminobutyricum]MBN7773270.1 tail fiber protein [Clostridium aminobutyricum]